MKNNLFVIICFTLFFLQCKQTEIKQSNIAYCNITYMNLGNTFYIPRTPGDFYQTKDLHNITIKGVDSCEKFDEYFRVLKSNIKVKSQDEPIDPRFAIKIKYKDSTENSIFIDVVGYYMLDTTGPIYIKNFNFLKHIKKVVNDNKVVEWELWEL